MTSALGRFAGLYRSASDFRSKANLVCYMAEVLLYRVSHIRLRRRVTLRVDGSTITILSNSGDLGFVYEVLCAKVYESDLAFQAPPGGICVDVGANIGCVTLRWAQTNRTGRIVAIEPRPDSFGRLVHQLKANAIANATPIQAAVSSRAGTSMLEIDASGNMGRIHPGDRGAPGRSDVSVRTVTLDEIAADLGIPHWDLLKIDVEGHEAEVLRGGETILARTDRVVLEYHGPKQRQECIDDLKRHGFSVAERGALLFASRA